MKFEKNKIIFNTSDWLEGVDYLKINDSFELGTKGLAYAESFDPFRNYGYACPGYLPTDSTNISLVSATIRQGIVQGNLMSGAKSYLIEGGSKIHELTISTNTLTNSATFPHTIAGVNVVGDDMVKYNILTTPYAFYSYNKTGGWDIGRYDFVTTFDDVYMTTNAAGSKLPGPVSAAGAGFPHPEIFYENNQMYIGDRNFVHMFNQDGENFTPAVLRLPNDYVVTSFAKIGFYLVVFAYKYNNGDLSLLGESTAFFWDTFSSSFTFSKDLNDFYVSEAINYQNTIICFTSGFNDDLYRGNLRIKKYNGDIFETIATYASLGGLPIRGGVFTQGLDVFFNSGGKIMKLSSNNNGYILNELYTNLIDPFSGVCKSLNNTFGIFFSNGSGAGLGLRRMNTNYNISSTIKTKVVELPFSSRTRGRVTGVEIFYKKTVSSGRNFELQILSDQTAQFVKSSPVVSNTIERYEYDTVGDPFLPFHFLQLVLQWTSGTAATDAPEISRIEVEYELINI